MGVHEARGQLNRGIKDLMMRWAEAKSQWTDSQAAKFEERFLITLEQDLRSAFSAMDQMAVLISQAKHDCEE
jgi:hypothetical protein